MNRPTPETLQQELIATARAYLQAARNLRQGDPAAALDIIAAIKLDQLDAYKALQELTF